MGSVKEESASSAESVKAEPADMKGDQGIKQPLLSKLSNKSSPNLTSMVPAVPKVDLPAFRLAAEGLGGVRLAAVWVMTCLTIYFAGLPLCQFCRVLPYHDPVAAAAMDAEVPHIYYKLSAGIFMSFFFVNLLPLAYETGPAKQQLSILLSFVKLISAYVDWEITRGGGVIVFDGIGRPMLLHRHFQWLTTSSTLVYCVSKMSDYSQAQVLRLVGLQGSLIVTGTMATLMTSWFKWPLLIYTLTAFATVQIGIWRMINTAREACSDAEQRRRLQFLRNVTPHVWNTFWFMWFCQYFGILTVFQAELGNMIGNFVAKALLSSSIMFSNFMSIYQRRAESKEKAEQSNRLKLIEDLQESMRVKEEFLSMVSHELRTPLNGIIGLSEAMLRPGSWSLGDKGTHYIKTIKNSSNHLATLINDILDAAAMAKGKLVIKQETVDLKKVVDHVCDTAGHLLKPRVTLEKMVDQTTPSIAGDGSRIVQILYNLVGNSAKFTTDGSITVMLKPMPCSDPGKEFVQLSVRDTGCGISKEKQRDMFVPFGQGDMTATRKFGGTGLGLSITKKLIEAHNGIIAVESTLGVGSTFIVQLPVQAGGKVEPQIMTNRAYSVTFGSDAESRKELAKSVSFHSDTIPEEGKVAAAPQAGATAAVTLGSAYVKAMQPGLTVTSVPLNIDVPPSPRGTLAPAVSYKLIKLDQSESKDGSDPTPKFVLAGQDANDPLLPTSKSKHLKNRKIRTRLNDASSENIPGTPASMKNAACLTDSKPTNNEEFGTTQILSVDDEPVNHMVIEECISSTGYKLHCETSGAEALKWITNSKVLPDLILLDCMMPGMSGHEFCTELRKTVPDAVVPVIMVSAKNDEANIVEGLSHGCNDFVSKPVKRAELLARIKAQLRVKTDATWVQSIVKGVLTEDSEAMKILESILPESIISRIQDGHQVIGDSHEHVVILFSDIVGFSTMASTMSAVEVFLMLSNLYYAFDRLVDKFGIYKVETIGDGYMLAAGHDEDEEKVKIGTPLERVLLMANAMLDAIKTFKSPDGKNLRIRIGVHCGGAYAGVIGMKCPRYCFLGDTVNTASRMESNSFPMCIHVSQAVVDRCPARDQFISLGERQIKGKGIMVTSLYKGGDWEAALDRYNIQKEQTAGIPLSPTGLSRQGTRKIGVLGRTATINPLTRQATMNLNTAGGKRAQAVEGLKQQVEDLKAKLKTEKGLRKEDSEKVQSLEVALQESQAELKAEKLLLHEIQRNLSTDSSVQEVQRVSAMVEVDSKAKVGASLGYNVRTLLKDLGLEVYADRFEAEKVRLHVLLGMDHEGLERLGVHALGERETIINGVYEYLRAYLRAAEPFASGGR
ncbi:hypothetical protein WJX82_000391 [Trebouxia sp. C0006]